MGKFPKVKRKVKNMENRRKLEVPSRRPKMKGTRRKGKDQQARATGFQHEGHVRPCYREPLAARDSGALPAGQQPAQWRRPPAGEDCAAPHSDNQNEEE